MKDYGIVAIRPIVLSLFDPEAKLSALVSQTLTQNFSVEQVRAYFAERQSEFASLSLILRKLVSEINFVSEELLAFFKQLLGEAI